MTYIIHKRQHALWLKVFFEQAYLEPVVLEFLTMQEAQRARRQLYRYRHIVKARDKLRADRYELVTLEITQPAQYKVILTGRTYRRSNK